MAEQPRPEVGFVSVVEVRGLEVDLGGRRVIDGVDLTVERGEFVGLLGPNGAGKTTLLRSLLGVLTPAAGTVRVLGEAPRRSRTRMGYVPQRHEFAWDFPIDVDHAVMSGRCGLLGVRRRPGIGDWQAVRDALERVGLVDLRQRPVGELSGGQRQRVLVARALALEPEVLLLDEPFTGLDLPSQEMLGQLFAGLALDGHAVVMATHDLLGALAGCSRLVLLDGVVVADGPPGELNDPLPWCRTFSVGPGHPLLEVVRAIGAGSPVPRGAGHVVVGADGG